MNIPFPAYTVRILNSSTDGVFTTYSTSITSVLQTGETKFVLFLYPAVKVHSDQKYQNSVRRKKCSCTVVLISTALKKVLLIVKIIKITEFGSTQPLQEQTATM